MSAGDNTPVTVADVFLIAKKLRLKAYYDTGDPEGDTAYDAAVRGARTSTLIEVADVIDEVLQIDSALTQEDLSSWRR